MNWPKYFKDRLILGNPDSDSAIATLWTPMNVVAKMTDVYKVSIIGQLYTKRGINYLLRNVLSNPKIKRILLVGADLMGSGEELAQLAEDRLLQTDWLDENISVGGIKKFFKNVEIVNKIGPVSPEKITDFISKSKNCKQWSKPLEFPEQEAGSSGGLPSEESGFTVRGEKVWQSWIRLLREIMRFGRPSPMIHHYGAERTTEIFNLTAVIYGENPESPELPKWLPYSKDDIKKYAAGFLSASRGDEAYTYGERIKAYPLELYKKEWFNDSNHLTDSDSKKFVRSLKKTITDNGLNQQELLAKKLKSFPENKGAVAILWEPIIDNFGLREIWRTPCLVLVQAVIRDKKLFLTAYFRSNDMYGGWFLNAFGLLAFQKELAGMIGKNIKLGPLTTISHSAHIYESSWQLAEKLVHDHWIDVSCEWDPRGNLHFETDGKFIVVKHLSPDGIFLDEYRQNGMEEKAAKRLCFALESAGLFSTVGNAMYAARQIERAETAIKLELPFISDEPLNFKNKYAK
ncbi:hypothetical protein HZB78_00505 [Candidatus Collierbacteria bacterium]|nr:hypothetical protein [Candidatus Collierbacteria bacterium]